MTKKENIKICFKVKRVIQTFYLTFYLAFGLSPAQGTLSLVHFCRLVRACLTLISGH